MESTLDDCALYLNFDASYYGLIL